MERKIITEFVFPPIPVRVFDWSAVRDGYEPGDPIGEWSCGSGNATYGERAWANIWPETQPFPASLDVFEEGDCVADAIERVATRVRALMRDRAAIKIES